MNTVSVWTTTGEHWSTGFNGNEDDAILYFLGKTFNIGVEDDLLVVVNRVVWRKGE